MSGCAVDLPSFGKACVVPEYRPFRNIDPPGLMEVWHQAFKGRGAVPLTHGSLLEGHVFAKPYFDPAGLIVAHDGDHVAGFAHAGFGPNADESGLSMESGVVALAAVAPAYQRQGIGSELLRRCEDYLRGRGARVLSSGSTTDWNPFYQGLYGGSESAGFLASDPAAAPFLTRHGYHPWRAYPVLQRRLAGSVAVADGRFAGLRRRFELGVAPRRGITSWWRECVLGPLELIDFRLEEKVTGKLGARLTVWEMEGFGRLWGEAAVGLVELEVRADLRRQGLGRFLLAQTFRYLQDQYFTLVEAEVADGDEPATNLFRSVGFAQVDTGHIYRKEPPA
jgi:ribosomal protein S18 acetylase RimI-like enzyme